MPNCSVTIPAQIIYVYDLSIILIGTYLMHTPAAAALMQTTDIDMAAADVINHDTLMTATSDT